MTKRTEQTRGWSAPEGADDQLAPDARNPVAAAVRSGDDGEVRGGAPGRAARRHPSASVRARTLVERVRQGMRRFPAVAVLSCLATVIGLLLIYEIVGLSFSWVDDPSALSPSFLLEETFLSCALAMPVVVATQLAAERAGWDERRARSMQLVVAAVATIAFVAIAIAGRQLGRMTLGTMVVSGIAFAATLLLPWLLMDERNERALVPHLVSMCTYVACLVTVLMLGLSICVLALQLLVFGVTRATDNLYGLASLLCWALLAPNLACAQLPRRTDELRSPRAYRGLVGSVIFPLCLLLLAVLYVYIAKIAVIREMPSGEMNWFGSFALLVWACLWVGLRDIDSQPARWFIRWGWALLVPVVAVQLVGVGIRLSAYGLTAPRCASLACIGVGIFALVLAALGRPPRQLFAVAAAVCLVVTVSPANILDMANLNQAMRLRSTLSELGGIGADGLVDAGGAGGVTSTEAQREHVTSAWDYLRTAERGYLSDPLVSDLLRRSATEDFESLFGFPHADANADDRVETGPVWHLFEFQSSDASIGLDGFTRAYDLDMATVGSTQLYASEGYRLTLSWSDGTGLDLSLSELMEGLTGDLPLIEPDAYSTAVTLPPSELRVELPDGRVLALQSVSVQTQDGAIDGEVTVSGLLLVR